MIVFSPSHLFTSLPIPSPLLLSPYLSPPPFSWPFLSLLFLFFISSLLLPSLSSPLLPSPNDGKKDEHKHKGTENNLSISMLIDYSSFPFLVFQVILHSLLLHLPFSSFSSGRTQIITSTGIRTDKTDKQTHREKETCSQKKFYVKGNLRQNHCSWMTHY